MPSAFVSVSLGVLQGEKEQNDLRAIALKLCTEAGWQPALIKHVAGALPYTRYGLLKRLVMKRIAAKAGGGTDTTRDYEYTDWPDVEAFGARFLRLVRIRAA